MKIAGPYKHYSSGFAIRHRIDNGVLIRDTGTILSFANEKGELKWSATCGSYNSKREAMDAYDEWLVSRGYIFVSQEQFDKYLVLL